MAERLALGVLALSCALAVSAAAAPTAAGSGRALTYCVPVRRIDWNPFREIKDGKELAYLLLARSYISTAPGERGILEGYEFSPDGKKFRGKIDSEARWRDGAPVRPVEAALGIAEGFRHRPIGSRVSVIETRVVNEREFELSFDSSVENLTGVVREALSSPSRHNRVWPARLSPGGRPLPGHEVLLRYPSPGPSLLRVGSELVRVVPASGCGNADFTLYPEVLGADAADYEVRLLRTTSATTLQINTRRLELDSRRALAAWVREAFLNLPRGSGFDVTDGFFLPGEPGYREEARWPVSGPGRALRGRRLVIGIETPIFRRALEAQARRDGIDVLFVPLPLNTSEIDAQVLASSIQDGRQVIFQDLLKWGFVDALLGNAPRTRGALETIARLSASTIPPDNETLQGFAEAARAECALAPVGRRHVPALTRKRSPVILAWDEQGSPVFQTRPAR